MGNTGPMFSGGHSVTAHGTVRVTEMGPMRTLVGGAPGEYAGVARQAHERGAIGRCVLSAVYVGVSQRKGVENGSPAVVNS
jgi:hypothetical protein